MAAESVNKLEQGFSLVEVVRAVVDSDRNPAKKTSLLAVGEKLGDIDKDRLILLLGIDNWWRETFFRQGRNWSLRDYGINSLNDVLSSARLLGKSAIEGFRSAGLLALNDRIGNEFTQRVIRRDKAGQLLDRARENPVIGDHGRPHIRRVERLMEMAIGNIWFLRHGLENIQDIQLAGYLYIETHDWDQAIAQQRNFENETDFETKKEHGLAAAVRVGVMVRELMAASDMNQEEAQRILAIVQVMDIIHGESELIHKRLTAVGEAKNFRDKPKTMYEAWRRNEINVFSLTPKDMILILREAKALTGMVNKATTPNGLDVEFESSAGYQGRLRDFAKNDQRTLGEMIGFSVNAEERDKSLEYKQFKHLLDVCVLADLLDMYTPPVESVFRRFLVPYSRKRPIYRRRGMSNLEQVRRNLDKKGNISSDDDSDLRRSLWEIINTFKYLEDSRVGRSTFVSQRLLPNLAVCGLLGLYKTYTGLMGGSLDQAREAFLQKEKDLILKAMRRMRLTDHKAMILLDRYISPNLRGIDRSGILASVTDEDIQEDLNQAFERLDKEAIDVRAAIAGKPNNGRLPLGADGIVKYRNDDILHMQKVIGWAARMLKITNWEELVNSSGGILMPYRSYYPLGRTKPKVIHAGVVD